MLAATEHLSVKQLTTRFGTDEAARQYLEAVRWPNGAVCPHCPNEERKPIYAIPANPTKKVRAGLYECGACRRQFTVTVGTIFEDSKIPLRKWLTAWWMLCASDKGMSALEMQRKLQLGSYRSAWFMMNRIRYALREPIFSDRLGRSVVGGPKRAQGKAKSSSKRTGGRISRRASVDAVGRRRGSVRSAAVKEVTEKTSRHMLEKKLHKPVNDMANGLHRGPDTRLATHRTGVEPGRG